MDPDPDLESDRFYVIGNALQYSSVPCLAAMANTIASERQFQTLGFVLVSPARRLPLFLGRSLGGVGGLVGAEALVGLTYGVLGYAALRAMEWQSRRYATLEQQ